MENNDFKNVEMAFHCESDLFQYLMGQETLTIHSLEDEKEVSEDRDYEKFVCVSCEQVSDAATIWSNRCVSCEQLEKDQLDRDLEDYHRQYGCFDQLDLDLEDYHQQHGCDY